jgi:hypothetical protein
MTDKIVPLRSQSGSFLARVDLYREPTGKINAVLVDMPPHAIEAEKTITARFFKLGDWMMQGALSFMSQGIPFDDETRAANDESKP